MAVDEFDVEQFVYIKIPADIQPTDRGSLFEDPIDAVLEPRRLGYVSGGGSQLGETRANGTCAVEFCGIDVNTYDRQAALIALRELLPSLGIPYATELHYTACGVKLQDRFIGADWVIGEAREFLHPGFDV